MTDSSPQDFTHLESSASWDDVNRFQGETWTCGEFSGGSALNSFRTEVMRCPFPGSQLWAAQNLDVSQNYIHSHSQLSGWQDGGSWAALHREASGPSAASSADPGGGLRETLLWRLPRRGSWLATTHF